MAAAAVSCSWRSTDGTEARFLDATLLYSISYSWEAVLIVLDSRPFNDLHHLLAEINDDRAWVFAEWVSPM